MTKNLFFILIVTTVSLNFALPALAQNWFGGDPFIPEACTGSQAGTDVNTCGLSQIFVVIVNVSKIILALTGSAALLMFTYGGVLWIIAAGNQERVQKGKAAMQAAAIGLAIILGAFLIVNLTICALTSGTVGCQAQLFGQDWFKEPTIN